jgi:hypothetical protein
MLSLKSTVRLCRPAWSGGELRGFRPDSSGGKRSQHPSPSVGRWVESYNNAALDSQYRVHKCMYLYIYAFAHSVVKVFRKYCTVADPWHFGTDPDADLESRSWLTDLNSDLGGPKTYGSNGSESGTVVHLHHKDKNSHKEVTKQKKFKILLTFSWWWWKDPELDPYWWLKNLDADPGGPRTYGSYGSGSVSTTLLGMLQFLTL